MNLTMHQQVWLAAWTAIARGGVASSDQCEKGADVCLNQFKERFDKQVEDREEEAEE